MAPLYGVFVFPDKQGPFVPLSRGKQCRTWRPGLALVSAAPGKAFYASDEQIEQPYAWDICALPDVYYPYNDICHAVFLTEHPRLMFYGAHRDGQRNGVVPEFFSCHKDDMIPVMCVMDVFNRNSITIEWPQAFDAALKTRMVARAYLPSRGGGFAIPCGELREYNREALGFKNIQGQFVPYRTRPDIYLSVREPKSLAHSCEAFEVACHGSGGRVFLRGVRVAVPDLAARQNPVFGKISPGGTIKILEDPPQHLLNKFYPLVCSADMSDVPDQSLPSLVGVPRVTGTVFGVIVDANFNFDFPKPLRFRNGKGEAVIFSNSAENYLSVRKASATLDLSGVPTFSLYTRDGLLPGKFIEVSSVRALPPRRCVAQKSRLVALRQMYPGMPASYLQWADAEIRQHYEASASANVQLSTIPNEAGCAFLNVSGALVHALSKIGSFAEFFPQSPVTGAVYVRPFSLCDVLAIDGFLDALRGVAGSAWGDFLSILADDGLRDRVLALAILR